jgi:hypothetical protein
LAKGFRHKAAHKMLLKLTLGLKTVLPLSNVSDFAKRLLLVKIVKQKISRYINGAITLSITTLGIRTKTVTV